MTETDWATTFAWALDFVRAMRERPLWAKILFRIVQGRYAYREFYGIVKALKEGGFSPYSEYELEHMNYHKDLVPFDWWTERRKE